MTSGVTVTVEINLKPEEADAFCDTMLPQLQKQTQAFAGVRSVRAVRQAAEPTRVLFIDVFDTVEASDAYFKWRGETGDLDLLGSLVSEPPRISVWPTAIDPAA